MENAKSMYLIANVMMMICDIFVEGTTSSQDDDTCAGSMLRCVGCGTQPVREWTDLTYRRDSVQTGTDWRTYWNVDSSETHPSGPGASVIQRVGPVSLYQELGMMDAESAVEPEPPHSREVAVLFQQALSGEIVLSDIGKAPRYTDNIHLMRKINVRLESV